MERQNIKPASRRNINLGLLVLRIGIGSMFILHGWPKMLGGPAGWHHLGQNMHYLGIYFLTAFWGFMAMAAELFGGVLLIIGLAVRPASGMILFTMLVAAIGNISLGYGLEGIVEIIEVSTALLTLLIAGMGDLTLSAVVSKGLIYFLEDHP